MVPLIKDNKAVFNQITDVVVGLAAVLVTFAILFVILAQAKDQVVETDGVDVTNSSTYTTAYNATTSTIEAAATVPDWLDLIVLAVVGAILLGLVELFRSRGRR